MSYLPLAVLANQVLTVLSRAPLCAGLPEQPVAVFVFHQFWIVAAFVETVAPNRCAASWLSRVM